MTVLISADSRIMVQGITGKRGRFYAMQMLKNGSQLVGGASPGKGGDWCFEGRVPIFDTVKECVQSTNADVSIIYVPPHATADAILEAIDSGIKTIISITGSIPLQDMMTVKSALKDSDAILVGPNSPGVLVPGIANAGIFPDNIAFRGNVGLISRSGTLCYEVLECLTQAGIGISTAVCLGDDSIIGIDFQSCLELFEADPQTDQIVMIGGPGGDSEIKAANYIMNQVTKPVIALIVGENLAGSLLKIFSDNRGNFSSDVPSNKTKSLIEAGVLIAKKIDDIPPLINR